MTQRLLSTCAALFLLLLAGCTSAPKPPTQVVIEPPRQCPLIPCTLPARPAPQANDDLLTAIDELESELLHCAAQVVNCIKIQE